MPNNLRMLIRRVCVADPERTQFVPQRTRPTGESQIRPQAWSARTLSRLALSLYTRSVGSIDSCRSNGKSVLGEHLMNQSVRGTLRSFPYPHASLDKQGHRLEAFRCMAIEQSDRGAAGRGRGVK